MHRRILLDASAALEAIDLVVVSPRLDETNTNEGVDRL
jgi:hypothetical protein